MDRTKIKRILFITLSNLGDAILTMPVLDALSKNFPYAKIDVFSSPSVRGIFEKDKRVSKVFLYDKHSILFDKYRLLKKLKGLRYNLIVDLKNTMIPIMLMPPYRTAVFRKIKKPIHKKEEHLLRIRQLEVKTEDARFNITVGNKDREKALELLKNYTKEGKYIVVNAGAKSHIKRWPVENFSQISGRIIKELQLGVVLIGKDDGLENLDSDRAVINKLLDGMNGEALDLVGKTNIGELAYIIKSAKALITNDSAPLHIGSAVNTPTLAIFGPTDENKYGPLSDQSVVLRKKLHCTPCEKAQCRYNYECLKTITVEDVFKAVKHVCEY